LKCENDLPCTGPDYRRLESQKGKILNEEEYLHELIQATLQMKQNKRTYFVVTQLDGVRFTLMILFLLSQKKESTMQSNQENLNLQSKSNIHVRPKNLQGRSM